MQLLNELLNVAEKRAILKEAAFDNALTVTYIQSGAQYLLDGGRLVSVENIADIMNIPIQSINNAIQWAASKKGKKGFIPQLNVQEPAKSDYDKLRLAIKWRERRTREAGLPVSDDDRARSGFDKTEELTGFNSLMTVNDLIEQHYTEIMQEFPNFKPNWVNLPKPEIRDRNNSPKNRSTDTTKDLIRKAVLQLSNGRDRSVTAEALMKWQDIHGNKIGLSRTAIDKLLSTDPDLADLDRYRAYGKVTAKTTDRDREAAYRRSQKEKELY